MQDKTKKKILLTGGGTGGATTPLLAVAEVLEQHRGVQCVFVGTPNGPERQLVEAAGLPFFSIRTAKLRRYWDLRNVTDALFWFPLSLVRALRLLLRIRPDLIFSVGSFVSVPFAIVGKLLRIPMLIHQQDLRPGLANRLMVPFAKKITVSFEPSLKFYPASKTLLTGNPVRTQIVNGDAERARTLLNLKDHLPVILVMGGGTGALALNEFVVEHLDQLTGLGHVVHLTGKGKYRTVQHARYHSFEFLSKEMGDVMALADVVVSRAGIASLTELAALGKATIFVPIPGTHQEENAKFIEHHGAGIVLPQSELAKLPELLRGLVAQSQQRERLRKGIRSIMPLNAGEHIADQLLALMQ